MCGSGVPLSRSIRTGAARIASDFEITITENRPFGRLIKRRKLNRQEVGRYPPIDEQPVSKLPGAQRPQKGPDHRRQTIRLVIGKPMACVLQLLDAQMGIETPKFSGRLEGNNSAIVSDYK